MDNKLELSAADHAAVEFKDSNYINNKGAKLYQDEAYGKAVEYYHLAAAMGNTNAIANLGYCYLYGRSIEPNTALAIAYFKTAALNGDADAAYKLGDIYSRDKWVAKDKELSLYYYRMAANVILGEDVDSRQGLMISRRLQAYPSLCFALGREMAPGGDMNTDLEQAYIFLRHAQLGYERELANGSEMYRESYEAVMKLLADPQYDIVRLRIERFLDLEEGL